MLSGLLGGLLSRFCRLACNGQRGTGVAELAMLSMLATSGVFATAVIASGDEAFEKLQGVMHQSFNRVGGTLEVRGSVIVSATGAPLQADTIQFSLGTFGQLPGISTRPEDGGMTVSYYDNTAVAANVPYSVRFSPGNNGDALLDGGELMNVTVRVSDIEAVAGKHVMLPGKRWTMELNVPDGPSLEFSRAQPAILSPVMAQR
jgi:hypothetical protein